MKRLFGVVLALCLTVGALLLPSGQSAIAAGLVNLQRPSSPVLAATEFRNRADDKLTTEFGKKIDLNNTNIRAFTQYPGLYPTLARKILENAPFNDIKDVFEMPGLTPRQIEILQANLDNFTLSDPEATFVEGGDRFNNGIYR